jgi:thiol-disulfide isomerase/thioredoxin
MRLNIILILCAVAAIFAFSFGFEHRPAPHAPVRQVPVDPAAPVGNGHETAPSFTVTTLDGRTVTLEQYRGRAVVLNFWASWCVPCVAEFPQLVALARALPDDVVILALSNDDERAAIDTFLQRHGQHVQAVANFIIAHDRDKAVTQDLFQTVRLPESILIDAQGRMREKVVGAVPWDDPAMQDKLRAYARNAP